MNIFVTGGAGYIGSVLVPMLLNEGHEVTVLDNFMYQQSSLLYLCRHKNFEIVRGDARDKFLVEKHLRKADVIFPLACLTGAPICDRDPWAARSVNVEAIRMILNLKSKDQGIIFPNTNSGYGIGQQDIYCTEKTPLRPVSLYGRLKVEIESDILSQPNTISFRLATVFGISPRMRIDLLVNDFTYRAVHDGFVVLYEGHFKRNFIYIGDVARAFLYGLKNFNSMKEEVYNVGLDDANLSKVELCQVIQKFVPSFYFSQANFSQDPDQRNYIVSNEKIRQKGFQSQVTLEEGIEELLKGYKIISNATFSNV